MWVRKTAAATIGGQSAQRMRGGAGQSRVLLAGIGLTSLALTGCLADDDDGFGSPGVDETPTAEGVVVIFTEVMANPEGVSDAEGEWIELYNPSTEDIDVSAWTVTDASGESITLTDNTIAAKGYLVLGNNNANSSNGGVSVDIVYDAGFTLGNDQETLILANADGAEVDSISYTSAPKGASLSLDPSRYDVNENDRSDSFCATRFSELDSGDFATPGRLNDVCFVVADPGDLIITEIMANPLAVDDDLGEFIEIYNPSSATIKLDGWVIKDGAGDVFTIASGGSLEIKSRAYLVLGSHAEQTENGGVPVDFTYSGALIFDDLTDLISLYAGTTLVDSVGYGTTGFIETPVGASLQLDSAAFSATENDDGGNWCASVDTMAGGADKASPGEANATCP